MGLSSGLRAFRVGRALWYAFRGRAGPSVTWASGCEAVGCSRGEFVSFGGKAGPNGLVCAGPDGSVCLLSFWPEQDHSPIFRILPRVNCPAIFRLQ